MKIKNILSVNNAYYLLVFLMLLPMMIWRDFTPANELRYLSIADEALQNGILFSFYNHGIMYADKPPLYLWIVMLGKLIFGSHQMWFLSLFSLLPAFVIQVIMDKWTSIELSPGHRFSAAHADNNRFLPRRIHCIADGHADVYVHHPVPVYIL